MNKVIVYGIIGIILGYLACAFYSATLSIAYWTEATRFICVVAMGCGAFMGAVLGFDGHGPF